MRSSLRASTLATTSERIQSVLSTSEVAKLLYKVATTSDDLGPEATLFGHRRGLIGVLAAFDLTCPSHPCHQAVVVGRTDTVSQSPIVTISNQVTILQERLTARDGLALHQQVLGRRQNDSLRSNHLGATWQRQDG